MVESVTTGAKEVKQGIRKEKLDKKVGQKQEKGKV